MNGRPPGLLGRRSIGDILLAGALAAAILWTCSLSCAVRAEGLQDSTVAPELNPQPHLIASIGAPTYPRA